MAVTNFIQTIWSKKIQDDLELKCKLVDNCLRDYEGDVKHAQSVKILGVGEPTIGAYDGTQDITIEEMSDKIVKVQEVQKNNITKIGILVLDEGSNISPTFYVDQFIDKPVHEMVQFIMNFKEILAGFP